MPAELKVESHYPQQPIHFRYSPLLRGIMIIFAGLVSVYSLYFLIVVVNADTPLFFKLLPLIIMFVSLNSALKHLTALNCVSFLEDRIRYSYITKRKVEIKYSDVLYMELRKQITYTVQIRYRNEKGEEKLFITPASFPRTLEIMLIIADLCPNIKLSDKLSNAVENLRTKAE